MTTPFPHLGENFSHIIIDIEGTVSPISFVHDVMFPYVRDNLEAYIQNTWLTPETKQDIRALYEQSVQDKGLGVENIDFITICPELYYNTAAPTQEQTQQFQQQVIDNVLSQMSIDRKIAALKQLQGHIWKNGFESGQLLSHLFPDVFTAFERWKKTHNKELIIYSSGSIYAQRLFFQYTINGDLLPLISDHFDTTNAGNKRVADSYTTIASTLQVPPEQCLFLTDIYEEAQAAKKAQMNTLLVVRPDNNPLPHEDVLHAQGLYTIHNFNNIFP